MKVTAGKGRLSAPTPKGIELIEKGEMVPYHPEIYTNFNTVVLEQYMEERNRARPQEGREFSWIKLVLMVLLIGVPFAFVTQYVALKTGYLVSSLFYVAYLIGLALRFKDRENNIISSATNLVDQTMVAFAFVYPVIFLLAYDNAYQLTGNVDVISEGLVKISWLVPVVIVVSTTAVVLSIFHFVIFRRVWIVEEPLPTPGFESLVKLMELSHSVQSGSMKAAVSSMKKIGLMGIIGFAYAFIREYPVIKGVSVLRWVFSKIGLERFITSPASAYELYIPASMLRETRLGISLVSLYFVIGWYMRSKTAFMVFLGSAFMWFFMVPLSLYLHMPYYLPVKDVYVDVNLVHLLYGTYPGIYSIPARNAFMVSMNVAIGAVLGAGMVALLRVIPTIKDMLVRKGGTSVLKTERSDGAVGVYEWPGSKVPYMMGIAFGIISLTLLLVGGFDIVPSLVIALYLTAGAFVLQAIAVRVAGMTGSGPTVMMVCISFISLFLILKPITGAGEGGRTALIIVLGTTAFIASMMIAITIQWDYKTGLYIGTRPIDLFKAQITAVIVGVPICALVSSWMSMQMAKGLIEFDAPWPGVYATIVMALSGGHLYISLLLLGVFVGAFIELMTRKGTVFGFGMFFAIGAPIMMLIGGVSRDIWQKRLERRYGKDRDGEEKKTMKLLDSYMLMTGIFLGEAMVGLLLMIYFIMN